MFVMKPKKSLALALMTLAFSIGCKNQTASTEFATQESTNNQSVIEPVPNLHDSGTDERRVSELLDQLNETKPDIFAFIWNLPESHIRTTRMGDDGKPISENAQVVLHEQGRAGDCLDQDNAPKPLLTGVDEAVFDEPTFRTFINLLDNYTAAEQKPEITFEDADNQHWTEVDAFLDAVFATIPIRVAVAHIQNDLAPKASKDDIRKQVKKMWFQPYTNRYRAAQPYCVGFEHVFVGEDESNESGAPNCQDRVGGYHSWIKFYLEQKQDKVNYLGYDYPEGNISDALADHKVATMLMRWSPSKEKDGGYGNDLLKKPGGFFIGTRPELEIAFGMLAMYAQKANKYDNVSGKENHHRVKLGQNLFDLVMHPESVKPGVRGDHIRTLYPKFRGSKIPSSSQKSSNPMRVDLPTQPHNDATIQILRALPNPATEGDIGEWVEIKNGTHESIELKNWKLKDQSGRIKELSGSLGSGQSLKIMLERVDQNSMMLKNGNGWILLFENDVRRAGVRYSKPGSGKIIDFDTK